MPPKRIPQMWRSQRYQQSYTIVQQWLTAQEAWLHPRKVLRDATQHLVQEAATQLRGACVVRMLIVALCAVGPEGVGPPPREVYGALLGLLRRLPRQQRVQRCLEVVVAYGTGGWPVLRHPPYATPWHAAWPRTFDLLREEIEGWMQRVLAWLDDIVIGFARAMQGAGWNTPAQQAILAHEISYLLVEGRCDCYQRHDPSKTATAQHLREHQLLAWSPDLVSQRGARVTLWDFVAQAVKGAVIGRQQFAAGAFVAGMLYPLLYRQVQLTLGRVARKRCPHCDRPYEVHLALCPHCDQQFDPTRDAIVAERLLIIPSPTGPYWPQPWWRCDPCAQSPRGENYFRCQHCQPDRCHPTVHDACPRCRAQHGQRASWLFER